MAEQYQLAAKFTLDAKETEEKLIGLNDKLKELTKQQEEFIKKFGEASPEVAQLNKQIADLQTEIANIKPVEVPVNIGDIPEISTPDVPPVEIPVTTGPIPPIEPTNVPPIEIPVKVGETPPIPTPEVPSVEIPIGIDPNTETDITKLEDALSVLTTKAEEFKVKFGESSPEFTKINEQIGSISKRINDIKPAKSIGELKKDLREANNELEIAIQKFGKNSKEAEAAGQKVKGLKKEVDDLTKATKGFDADATFGAWQDTLGGIKDGFGMVEAGMDLFGAKSEFVSQSMEKIQGAIDLGDKIKDFMKIKDAVVSFGLAVKSANVFQVIWNAATAAGTAIQRAFGVATAGVGNAFKVLRMAIISTGIGALVVGVGALVAGIMSWISSTNKAKEANERLAKSEKGLQDSMKETNKQIKKRNDDLEFANEMELAKAKELGKSKEEIRKIEQTQNKTALDNATKDLNDAYNKQHYLTEQAEADLALVKEKGDEDEIKEAQQHYDQIIADLQSNVDEQVGIIDGLNKDKQRLAQRYANEDAEEKREKEQKDKDDAERKKEEAKRAAEAVADANKQSKENIRKTNQEIALLQIKDEDERAKAKLKQDLDNAILEINQTKASETQKELERQAIKKKFAADEIILLEEQKKARDEKEKENREKEKQLIEEFAKETTTLAREIELAGMKEGYEKEKKQLENTYIDRYAAIEASETLNANQKLFLKTQLQLRENQELKKLDDEEAKRKYDEALAEQQKIVADPKSSAEAKRAAVDAEQLLFKKAFDDKLITEKEYNANVDALAAARIDIDQKEKEAKIKNAQGVANVLSGISGVIGKETAAGKAFAVAAATINTWAAAQQAFLQAQKNPISIIGPAYPYIQAGLAVAAGIKNVKEILKVKVPNGGGGGSVPTSTMTPVTPQLGGTMLNQGQLNSMVNSQATALKKEPIRAFVVESDVRNNQDRINRIERAATIG